MDSAMFDVRRVQDVIFSHGSWHEWQIKARGDYDEFLAWAKSTRGVSKKGEREGYRDINGNNFSFRSAKTRLHNLVIELEALSVLEQSWEMEHPINTIMGYYSPKRIRIQYSATNALALYKSAVEQGTFEKMQESCALFMRKRGRDWEVATSSDYPASDIEDEEDGPKGFKANLKQRQFINRSQIPAVEAQGAKAEVDAAPDRKRRRTDAVLSFNQDTYIRTEANVDVLRRAASHLDAETLDDDFVAAPTSGPSILRTTPLRVDARPKRGHKRRGLKRNDGCLRAWYRWDRRAHMEMKGLYRRGPWAAAHGSMHVDTSGHAF
jgi:hypothetical protein